MKKFPTFLTFLISACIVFLILSYFFINTGSVKAGDTFSAGFRTEEEQRTIDIYRSVNAAVVFITTISLEVDPYDFFLQVTPKQGTGSGVIVDAYRGIIITNLHVINDADKIEITIADGRNYKAKLIGYDKENDLAVLSFIDKPTHLTAIGFGDSSKLDVGQRVLAIGNPFGLNKTLTSGIISSLDRAVKSPTGTLLKGLIQTDAAINPGNSGGPLIDLDGKLIGINSAILDKSVGIGFAIPVNSIKRVLPELVATGRVLRPKMGWILVDTDQGPMVLRTLEGGPADKADIQPIERKVRDVFLRGYVSDPSHADLIFKINGKRVRNVDEVESIIATQQANSKISVVLHSGGIQGVEREVEITPFWQ